MRRVAGQRAGGRRLSESARAGLRGIREAGEQSLALCLPRSPPRCMLRVLCLAAFGGKGCCWCCKGCELSTPFRARAGARGWRVCCMQPVCLQAPRADARASLLPRAWAPLIQRVCLHACALVFASGRHHRRWPARQGALARHWRALRQRTQWWTPMPMPSTTTVSPESAFPHTPRVVR